MADLTYQDVLDILRIVDTGSFPSLEIEFEGTRIKVCRRDGGPVPSSNGGRPTLQPVSPPDAKTSPGVQTTVPSASAPKSAGAKPESSSILPDIADGVAVKPPMEGTFYAAPSPGAPPFVEIGQRVRKGDQVGTVEVMKLFTPVSSPCDGIVRAILVANEQILSKDQTLMIIQADA